MDRPKRRWHVIWAQVCFCFSFLFFTTDLYDIFSVYWANAGQRRPTKTNAGPWRPTKANEGQRWPTKVNDGQCRPTKSPSHPFRPPTTSHYAFLSPSHAFDLSPRIFDPQHAFSTPSHSFYLPATCFDTHYPPDPRFDPHWHPRPWNARTSNRTCVSSFVFFFWHRKHVYKQSYTCFLCFLFFYLLISPETRVRAIVHAFLMFLFIYLRSIPLGVSVPTIPEWPLTRTRLNPDPWSTGEGLPGMGKGWTRVTWDIP